MYPAKRATQDDVAQIAGVTRATVSYVLTGRAEELKITPAVVKRVQEAAAKLRYLPNLAARSLAAGRSRMIGLVIPQPSYVSSKYWGPIAAGVERASLKANYDVLLLASHDNLYETAESYLLQNRVDIIIILGNSASMPLERLPVPPIVIGPREPIHKLPCVESAVDQAIQALVDEFSRMQLRKVGWLGPLPEYHPGSGDRLVHLERLGKAAKIKVSRHELRFPVKLPDRHSAEIQMWKSQIEADFAALQKLDAVVCWNDNVALGLYSVMFERGLKPGRDLAVVGFDDYLADSALPPLASVSFEPDLMGEAAVELAVQLLASKSREFKDGVPLAEVQARLVIRESLSGKSAVEA